VDVIAGAVMTGVIGDGRVGDRSGLDGGDLAVTLMIGTATVLLGVVLAGG